MSCLVARNSVRNGIYDSGVMKEGAFGCWVERKGAFKIGFHSSETRRMHSHRQPFFFLIPFLVLRVSPQNTLKSIAEIGNTGWISYKRATSIKGYDQEKFPSISHDFPPYLFRNQFPFCRDFSRYL